MKYKAARIVPTNGCPMGRDDCIGCLYLERVEICSTIAGVHCDYDSRYKEKKV